MPKITPQIVTERFLEPGTRRVYFGERIGENRDGFVYVRKQKIEGNDCRYETCQQPLHPHNDLCNHSPDGFEWGYGGSGPSQLAFAIVYDFLMNNLNPALVDKDYWLEFVKSTTWRFYQDFKWAFIARCGSFYWCITDADVANFIAQNWTSVNLSRHEGTQQVVKCYESFSELLLSGRDYSQYQPRGWTKQLKEWGTK